MIVTVEGHRSPKWLGVWISSLNNLHFLTTKCYYTLKAKATKVSAGLDFWMSKCQLMCSTKAVVTKVCIFLPFAAIRHRVHGSKLIQVDVYFRLILQTESLLWHNKGIATGTAVNSLGSQVGGQRGSHWEWPGLWICKHSLRVTPLP